MKRYGIAALAACLVACAPQTSSAFDEEAELEEGSVSKDGESEITLDEMAYGSDGDTLESSLGSGLGAGLGSGLASAHSDYDVEEGEPERQPFDEYFARKHAEREVARKGYVGAGAPYGCTVDCSGHEAGFDYAQTYGEGVGSRSRSFDEGRQAYGEAVDKAVERRRGFRERT